MISAYEHGRTAAKHGKHIQACPFDSGTPEWREWRKGFCDEPVTSSKGLIRLSMLNITEISRLFDDITKAGFRPISHSSDCSSPSIQSKDEDGPGQKIHGRRASERICDGVTRYEKRQRYGVIKALEKHAVTGAARTSRSPQSFGSR
jgi:hypothetical protein